MKEIHAAFERIKTANENSPIAVELVKTPNKIKLRTYFANCIPAPKELIAKSHREETERQYSTGRPSEKLLLPFRDPNEHLGIFHGEKGAEKLRRILSEIGYFENQEEYTL